MSVTNNTPISTYVADGLKTTFALNFEVESKDNIKVTANSLTVSKNDYSYTANNNSINFYQPVAADTEIKLERITDLERGEDYLTFSNNFRPETLNYDFNRIWKALQERGVQNSEALAALINTLSTLSERDRTILDAVQDQALADIKQDTGVADLIKFEAEARKKSDEAYNLLAALEAGKTLPELKEYVDNILGIKNPNLLTGITSRLIVDHETGETVKDQYQQNINKWIDQGTLNDLYKSVEGAELVGFSRAKAYAQETIGGILNTITGKAVYLLSYIPSIEHSKIFDKTSTYDCSNAIEQAVNEAILKDATLILPEGLINYFSFPNIKTSNFKLVGQGSNKTVLNYQGTQNAMHFDAFSSGSPTEQFVQGLHISGFHIKGDNFTYGFFAQGIARSYFNDIMVNGSQGTDGTTAFRFAGCMLSVFNNLKTSYVYGQLPYRGLHLVAGSRAGSSVGGCSNNIFTACYAEGNSIGWQISPNGGDQNTFISGSPEACKIYGLVVGTNCRYNHFIGVGFENASAQTSDVNEAGIYSKYTTCYSAKSFIVSSSAIGTTIENGYFERIEVQANARAAVINQVTVNNWNTGVGGLIDNGQDTSATRVTDGQTKQFIYTHKPRYSITVGTSPYLWTNTNQLPVKIRVQGGTVTQVLMHRGTDTWTEANPTAAGGGTGSVGTYLLAAGESIEISYSSAPLASIINLPM